MRFAGAAERHAATSTQLPFTRVKLCATRFALGALQTALLPPSSRPCFLMTIHSHRRECRTRLLMKSRAEHRATVRGSRRSGFRAARMPVSSTETHRQRSCKGFRGMLWPERSWSGSGRKGTGDNLFSITRPEEIQRFTSSCVGIAAIPDLRSISHRSQWRTLRQHERPYLHPSAHLPRPAVRCWHTDTRSPSRPHARAWGQHRRIANGISLAHARGCVGVLGLRSITRRGAWNGFASGAPSHLGQPGR